MENSFFDQIKREASRNLSKNKKIGISKTNVLNEVQSYSNRLNNSKIERFDSITKRRNNALNAFNADLVQDSRSRGKIMSEIGNFKRVSKANSLFQSHFKRELYPVSAKTKYYNVVRKIEAMEYKINK